MASAAGTDLSPERIQAALRPGAVLGSPVQSFPVAVSTEAVALGWARQQDAPDGAIVLADVELSARGRRGIPWVSVAGRTLAFSVILRPDLPPEGEGLLWLLASVAAADGIAEASGVEAALKWPNDLLLGERRLGLVKAEAQLGPGRMESAVLTVRLNVGVEAGDLPQDVGAEVASLVEEGGPPERPAVVAAVLAALEDRYRSSVPDLLAAYRERCRTLGRRVTAHLMPKGEASGTAVDVDEGASLVLETPAGRGSVGIGALKRLETH